MSFEQEQLFDPKPPSSLTFEDFKNLWDYPHKSPLPDVEGDELIDEFRDEVLYMWRDSVTVEGLGEFTKLAEWSGGDGHEQGIVVQHVPTGIILMFLGVYSSWDSSSWDDIVEAEPFEFRETRYREVTK